VIEVGKVVGVTEGRGVFIPEMWEGRRSDRRERGVYTGHVGGRAKVNEPVGGALRGDDEAIEGGHQCLSVEGRRR
jgi:hypothetical protein